MRQPPLFSPKHPPSWHELRAREFHKANPQVYEAFCRFTFQAIKAGRPRFGAKMVWERMRWYTNIETDEEPWKLNNNYHAWFARYFMEEHPEHDGIFQVRSSG